MHTEKCAWHCQSRTESPSILFSLTLVDTRSQTCLAIRPLPTMREDKERHKPSLYSREDHHAFISSLPLTDLIPTSSTTPASELVSEMLVFLVRQILKAFEQLFLNPLSMQPFPVPRFVLKIAPRGVDNLEDNERGISPQEGLDCGKVSGDFLCEEQVGTDDVSCTIKSIDDCEFPIK